MGSAELTLWARLDGLPRDAVALALWEDRTLVKTWAMRGTLHLLPADELGLWQAGLATYRHYLKPVWLRAFGLTEAQLLALIDAVAEALSGPPLTRAELADAVVERTGEEALREKLQQGFGAYLKPAAFRGRLCFGPGDGQKVRFTRPDVWLGRDIEGPDGDDALREIARRYLAVHGPATREDLRRWWATTPAAAGKLLRSLEDAREVDVEGETLWMLAADAAEAAAMGSASGVRLLPAFDQYVVAATLQADALPARRLPRPDLPPAGVAVAGPARGRGHGGGLASRAQGAPAGRRGRAVRAPAARGACCRRGRGGAARRLPGRRARAAATRDRR